MNKKKAIIILSAFGACCLFLGAVIFAQTENNNLFGFAWNENTGWISFGSSNCDPDGDGKSNGVEANSACPSSGTKIGQYFVNVNKQTGDISGYAWSNKVGWISFNASDLVGCPSGVCSAKIGNGIESFENGSKKLSGWAKILSNDVWISLSGEVDNFQQTKYGAILHSDGSISGFAWSDKYGYISFSGRNYKVKINGVSNAVSGLSVTGAGFAKDAIVTLINTDKNGTRIAIPCVNESGSSTFTWQDSQHLVGGVCPMSEAFVGVWDVIVTNPNGQRAALSQTKSEEELFSIVPPSASDLSVSMVKSADNSGPVSIEKITSSNSLFGAWISLVKGNQIVDCFQILGYDPILGWNSDVKDLAGNLVQTCNISQAEEGSWRVVVSRYDESGKASWSETSDSVIAVSCVPDCAGKKCGYASCKGKYCNENGQVVDINTSSVACEKANAFGTCSGTGFKTCKPDQSGYGKCTVTSSNPIDAACAGKQCGSDGCGGICGSCISPKSCDKNFQCICIPQCEGKQCGSDGCGGTCGDGCYDLAKYNNRCEIETGKCVCTPDCFGKDCGSDGCGGTCGDNNGSCPASKPTCGLGQVCICNDTVWTPSDSELVTMCGQVEQVSNCGRKAIGEGGGKCSGYNTCGGGGVANKCGCTDTIWTPSDVEVANLCGTIKQTSNCGKEISVSGGKQCGTGQQCDSKNQCYTPSPSCECSWSDPLCCMGL